MRKRDKCDPWERTIDKLLGEDNPCRICLVAMTCPKSFTDGRGCEKLAKKLTDAMEALKKGAA